MSPVKPPSPSLRYVELTSPVIKRLIVGKEGSFLQKINSELRLVTVSQNTGQALKLGIRGSEIAEEATVDLFAKLQIQAQMIVNREKLDAVKQVKDHHWHELSDHFHSFLKQAKERISSEHRTKLAAEAAAQKAVQQVTEKLSPLLQAHKSATKKTGETAGVVKNGKAPLLEDKFQPRNQNSAIAYLTMKDPQNGVTFLAGDAGGGKTYTALRYGLEAYNQGGVDTIMIFRPRTTTGRSDMGAFPGGPSGKMGPYLRASLENNLVKMAGQGLEFFEKKGIIQAATPDLERGNTYDRSVVIVDEAQNLTMTEAELLLTRIGEGAKIIFTGDIGGDQNDMGLQHPGLAHIITVLGNGSKNDEILNRATAFIRFTSEDSAARNPLLPNILKAKKNLSPEYQSLLEDVSACRRDFRLAAALKAIRLHAETVLEEAAAQTFDWYKLAAKREFPGLFEASGDNVVPLTRKHG